MADPRKRPKPITVEELQARLAADPAYQERRRRLDDAHAARHEALSAALAPLLDELKSVGIQSAAELLVGDQAKAPPFPRAALPILIEHLQRPYPRAARAVIARAVAVPQSKFAWGKLVELYRREPSDGAKDDLAVAVEAVASDDTADDLIALVRDPNNGASRILLLRGLVRLSDPRAKATLREMRRDPDLEKELAVILRKLDKKNH